MAPLIRDLQSTFERTKSDLLRFADTLARLGDAE